MSNTDPEEAASGNPPSQSIAERLLAAYALGGRSFPGWNLAGANLHGADLHGCIFYRADFTGADLSGADLSGVNLSHAKLRMTNLRGANLSGAYLTDADLTGADMASVVTDQPGQSRIQDTAQPKNQSETHSPLVNIDTHLLDINPQINVDSSFCLHCHAALPRGAKFCLNCGKAQREVSESPWPGSANQGGSAQHATSTVPQLSHAQPVARSGNASFNNPQRSYTANSGVTTTIGVLALIADLITGGWNLIFKIALVIVAILVLVGFISSCSGLNEHSSCGQFEQADAATQNKALQDMMTAHNDNENISTTRASLTLYCAIYGESAPIDGIYGGGSMIPIDPKVL